MFLFRIATHWTIRVLLAALAAWASPGLALIAAMSIVGLPLAFLLMFVPAAASLYIASELAFQLLIRRRMPTAHGYACAVGAVLVGAVAVALLANADVDGLAGKLVSKDVDAPQAGSIRRLAVVGVEPIYGRRTETSACDGLCLRLLLNGAVEEILIPDDDAARRNREALTPSDAATAFRFARGSACPARRIENGSRSRLDGDDGARTPAELARLRAASGDCLMERAARLGEADAALVATEPFSGISPSGAGLEPLARTLFAKRLSLYRNEGRAFVETYRRTQVEYWRHPYILLPVATIEGAGGSFQLGVSFARLRRTVHFNKREPDAPDPFAFVRDRLKLPIAVSAALAPEPGAVVDAIVSRGAKTVDARDVVADYLASLDDRAAAPPSAEVAARVLRVLASPDLEIPVSSASAVRVAAAAQPGVAPALADALFDRIAAAAPGARESRYDDRVVRIAAGALDALPDAAYAGRRDRLLALARDPERRADAARVLWRLALYPDTAFDDLFHLVETARADKAAPAERSGERPWADVYAAGLRGLCRLGDPRTTERLTALLRADPDFRRRDLDRVVATLVAAGTREEEIRSLLGEGADKEDLADVDRALRYARAPRACN